VQVENNGKKKRKKLPAFFLMRLPLLRRSLIYPKLVQEERNAKFIQNNNFCHDKTLKRPKNYHQSVKNHLSMTVTLFFLLILQMNKLII